MLVSTNEFQNSYLHTQKELTELILCKSELEKRNDVVHVYYDYAGYRL